MFSKIYFLYLSVFDTWQKYQYFYNIDQICVEKCKSIKLKCCVVPLVESIWFVNGTAQNLISKLLGNCVSKYVVNKQNRANVGLILTKCTNSFVYML